MATIFDDQPTGSVGAIAVSVSNPDVIYVGSAKDWHRPDLSVGDGVYRSTDAGKTWTHLGLRDGQQIAAIAVDPKNPDRLAGRSRGHPYGPNKSAAFIFRLTAERLSRRRCPKTRTPARPTSRSIRRIRRSFTRRSGKRGKVRGKMDRGMEPTAVFQIDDGGKTWKQLTNGLA